jgi:hypothetical protein
MESKGCERFATTTEAEIEEKLLKLNAILVASLTALQSVNPNIDIVFLLFVLYFTLIIGNVEVNPSPLTNDISNTSLVNTVKSLAICNINIRSKS